MTDNWKTILAFIWVLLSATALFTQDLEDLSFGEDNSLDIATWNIEWFPKNGQITVEYVTEIMEQLELDVLAIQEVDNTDMFDQMDEKARNKLIESSALKRPAEAIEVANVALFLASDLSSFITGQILRVDGGLTT